MFGILCAVLVNLQVVDFVTIRILLVKESVSRKGCVCEGVEENGRNEREREREREGGERERERERERANKLKNLVHQHKPFP